MKTIKVKSKKQLMQIIKNAGIHDDLNHLNVSEIEDMSWLFYYSQFLGDISKWDVSSVTNMTYMFAASHFSGDISKWDVSSVTNMDRMFQDSHFSGDILNWQINKKTTGKNMFKNVINNFKFDSLEKYKFEIQKKQNLGILYNLLKM